MLVLARRSGEGLTIGNIRIVVLGVHNKKVRLGIKAPKEVPVVRDEAKNKEPRKR